MAAGFTLLGRFQDIDGVGWGVPRDLASRGRGGRRRTQGKLESECILPMFSFRYEAGLSVNTALSQ